MKAIVVRGPMQYGMEEREEKAPGRGEVLVRVKAVGLCGTDYDILANDMEYYKTGAAKLPIVPGHEWAGVVEALGPETQGFAPGDKVIGECTVSCGFCQYCRCGLYNFCENRTETGVMNRDGGLAQTITFPTSHLHKFENLPFAEAALVEPTGIAMEAVKRGRVGPFDNVLVVGPGPIGLLAAQIAKRVFGANRVLLSGTRDDRLERAAPYCDRLVNVRNQDLRQAVAEATGGRGIDVVIEVAASPDTFRACEGILRPGGRIVTCGFYGEKSAACNWDFITTNGISIIGSLGSPGVWPDILRMLEDGRLEVKSIISHEIELDSEEAFRQAVDLMVSRRDKVCKIILRP